MTFKKWLHPPSLISMLYNFGIDKAFLSDVLDKNGLYLEQT